MTKIKNPITIVQSGGGSANLVSKSITRNGTFNPADDNADGYNSVTVNVQNTGNKLPQYFNKTLTSLEPSDFGGITECPSFRKFSALTNVELSNTITSIPGYGFHQAGITSIKIPSSVTSIEGNAFRECYYIPEIIIPSSVTTINNATFYICINLKKIVLLSNSCTLSNTDAFYRVGEDTNGYTIYVFNPDDYRIATNWVAIASNIFPLVSTVADLANIDTMTYTKACVTGTDESYKEYTYNGIQWNEVT